ncbi:hypothetical protein ABG768_001640 [Culter alburnus]|uniref:Uncharacterized protein n=1 Tax=Culter alburnus TaxID=194366 RepID=A0AAW2A0X5_CULAL
MAPGATSQQCTVCYKQIGSASKSCKHCGITVKQKKSLEHQKLKFDHQWAAKLKKDGNICKIMNSVDLILHKLELLGVSPMLFITTQKGQHRSTKVLVKSSYIQSHPSVPVMQRLYEAVTRGNTSASVSNTSASASSDPPSVSNTSASASSEPASVSNTSASAFNTSASASSDPALVSNTSASASSEPASVSNTSASAFNTSASASSDPALVSNTSASASSDPPSVSNDPASASINSTTAANHPASVSSNSAFETSGTASLSNDPTPAFNDHISVPNDSAFTVNISNVFYKPIKRKGRQIHNGKKRISFSLAALRILVNWSNDAENSALHHRNKLLCEIYSNRKQLF